MAEATEGRAGRDPLQLGAFPTVLYDRDFRVVAEKAAHRTVDELRLADIQGAANRDFYRRWLVGASQRDSADGQSGEDRGDSHRWNSTRASSARQRHPTPGDRVPSRRQLRRCGLMALDLSATQTAHP